MKADCSMCRAKVQQQEAQHEKLKSEDCALVLEAETSAGKQTSVEEKIRELESLHQVKLEMPYLIIGNLNREFLAKLCENLNWMNAMQFPGFPDKILRYTALS